MFQLTREEKHHPPLQAISLCFISIFVHINWVEYTICWVMVMVLGGIGLSKLLLGLMDISSIEHTIDKRRCIVNWGLSVGRKLKTKHFSSSCGWVVTKYVVYNRTLFTIIYVYYTHVFYWQGRNKTEEWARMWGVKGWRIDMWILI